MAESWRVFASCNLACKTASQTLLTCEGNYLTASHLQPVALALLVSYAASIGKRSMPAAFLVAGCALSLLELAEDLQNLSEPRKFMNCSRPQFMRPAVIFRPSVLNVLLVVCPEL